MLHHCKLETIFHFDILKLKKPDSNPNILNIHLVPHISKYHAP